MLLEDILKYICITEGDGGVDGGQEVADTPDVPSEFEVDGEKFSPDQIKQFRSGYDNYTKTVAEFNKFKEEAKEATELYNYLKSNEELAKKLAEFDNELMSGKSNFKAPNQQDDVVRGLKTELELMKIEQKISSYKSKDKDFDEPTVVKLAVDNNIDIDLAYKVWKADRYELDMQRALKEQSKSITENISRFGNITKTLIGEMDKTNSQGDLGLSPEQLMMADKLGLTAEEYKKWL